MTLPLIVKYNSVAVEHVSNLKCELMEGNVGRLIFTIPNKGGLNHSTWKGYRWAEKVELFKANGTTLLWSGRVHYNDNNNPMRITSYGIMNDLSYDTLSDVEGKFILNSLYVKEAPADENLRVWTAEEEDPGISDDSYNMPNLPRYAIISDNTLQENNEVAYPYDNSANPDADVSGGSTVEGDNTDLTEIDTNYWWVDTQKSYDCIIYLKLKLETLATPIPITAQITQIKVEFSAVLTAETGETGPSYWTLHWNKNYSTTGYKTIDSKSTPVFGTTGKTWYYQNTFSVENSSDWFNAGDVNWEDGCLIIRKPTEYYWTGADTRDRDIKITYAKVTVYYATATFEQLNRQITDTINGVDADADVCDIIQVSDNAGGDEDLLGLGLASNDKVDVCIGIEEAIDRCNKRGLILELNNLAAITVGTSQDYGGIECLTAFQQLCKQQNWLYATDYSSGEYAKIKALDEDDIDAATITYSTSTDPCLEIIGGQGITAEPNEYGAVVVRYRYGTTSPIQADTPTSNPRTLPIDATYLNTLTEALDYGKKMANYYAKEHPSIMLTWQGLPTNFPQVLTKYNVTFKLNDGSAYSDIAYEDQICRKWEINWDGSNNTPIVIAYIGGGHTEPREKMAEWEGHRNRYEKIKDALAANTRNTVITNHNRMDGVLGETDSPHHISSTQYGYLDATSSVQDQFDNHTHDGRYYTESEINAYLAIGSANSRYHYPNPIAFDDNATAADFTPYLGHYTNQITGNVEINFPIDLPRTMGTLKLYLKNLKLKLTDADANNKVTAVYIYQSQTNKNSDATPRSTVDTFTYTFDAFDASGEAGLMAIVTASCDTQYALDIEFLAVEYYYA